MAPPPFVKRLINFNAAKAASGTDVIYTDQGSGEVAMTAAQLATLVQAPIANGTAPDAGTLLSTDTVPMGRNSLLQTTWQAVATFAATSAAVVVQVGVGAIIRSIQAALRDRINIAQFGAIGDGVVLTDGVMTAGTTAFTSASAAFTGADIGKAISIPGAGVAGATLVTTISAYVSAGSVTVGAAANTGVSGAQTVYGTDNTIAIQDAIAAVPSAGMLEFPASVTGRYLVQPDALVINRPIFMSSGRSSKWANPFSKQITLSALYGGGTLLNCDGGFNSSNPNSKVLGGGVKGITLDGGNFAFTTAIFKLRQFSEFDVESCGIANGVGYGVFMANTFEPKFNNVFVNNVDATGTTYQNVVHIDDFESGNQSSNVNNVRMNQIRVESCKGNYIGSSGSSNLDILTINTSKFETDLAGVPAGGPYFAFKFLSGQRIHSVACSFTNFTSTKGFGLFYLGGGTKDSSMTIDGADLCFMDSSTVLLHLESGANIKLKNSTVTNSGISKWLPAQIVNNSAYAQDIQLPTVQSITAGQSASFKSAAQSLVGKTGFISAHEIANTGMQFAPDATAVNIEGTVVKIAAGVNTTVASIPLSCFFAFNTDVRVTMILRTDATDANSKLGVALPSWSAGPSTPIAASPAGYAAYDVIVPAASLKTLGTNPSTDTFTIFSFTGSTGAIYFAGLYLTPSLPTQLQAYDGLASAPTYSYVSDPASGMYKAGSQDMRMSVGGVDLCRFTANTLAVAATSAFGFGSGGVGSIDTQVFREGAGVWAHRSGSNPHSGYYYNTFTSAAIYERSVFKWASNVLTIGTENAGAGTVARAIAFEIGNATKAGIDTVGNVYSLAGVARRGYSLQTPTTGFSITIANNVDALDLEPATTLASGTIVMPTTPTDGQTIIVSSTQTITALTVNPNTGQTVMNAPTTLVGGGSFRYKYNATTAKWYRQG